MRPTGFEPTMSTSERPQTQALNYVVTGIGSNDDDDDDDDDNNNNLSSY